uniref:Uncharacterized protein n=1 Tax=Leersia perrieri TaxID=77586 RepID=A0A0D9VWN8_9ORYZ
MALTLLASPISGVEARNHPSAFVGRRSGRIWAPGGQIWPPTGGSAGCVKAARRERGRPTTRGWRQHRRSGNDARRRPMGEWPELAEAAAASSGIWCRRERIWLPRASDGGTTRWSRWCGVRNGVVEAPACGRCGEHMEPGRQRRQCARRPWRAGGTDAVTAARRPIFIPLVGPGLRRLVVGAQGGVEASFLLIYCAMTVLVRRLDGMDALVFSWQPTAWWSCDRWIDGASVCRRRQRGDNDARVIRGDNGSVVRWALRAYGGL